MTDAPVNDIPETDTSERLDALVNANDIVLFMKGTPLFPQCGFSSRAIAILEHLERLPEMLEDRDRPA